ncbi:hypothetical protein GQX74_003660 [Glossina fuscipes]|nr:hypothetical protein GQX74_003660 [Glossina fuscipes]
MNLNGNRVINLPPYLQLDLSVGMLPFGSSLSKYSSELELYYRDCDYDHRDDDDGDDDGGDDSETAHASAAESKATEFASICQRSQKLGILRKSLKRILTKDSPRRLYQTKFTLYEN